MPTPSPSRLSAVLMFVAVMGIAAAYADSGAGMFSPGTLHAGDSTPASLGGVQSHRELTGSCSSCHAPLWSARTMAVRCLECHRDIQRDLADTTTLHGTLSDAKACTSCHTEHHGPTATLTRMDGTGIAHEQFGFSLNAHRRLDSGQPFTCASCHSKESFKFEAARCESCHGDYQRAFLTRHVADWGNDCQSCHDGRDRFSKGQFAHDQTSFPLTGAHVQTACVACHSNVTQLGAFASAEGECIGCHRNDDKHRGSLGTDCASCHSTATWDDATFDHSVFPLDHGDEGTIACKTCHQDTNNYKVYTCYGCHEHNRARVQAEHRGEVNTSNLDDCVRCHKGGRKEGGERNEGRERGRRDRGDH